MSHIRDEENPRLNVASRLSRWAREMPEAVALAEPRGRDVQRNYKYACLTFRQLEEDSNRIANGLVALGAGPGKRLVLLVPFGGDFVSLVYALYKTGATMVLIDPGMGLRRMVQCLADVEPDGFIAIPAVQAARVMLRKTFRQAKINVTVGRRWFWGGAKLDGLRSGAKGSTSGDDPSAPPPSMEATRAEDAAAIIFTSGSTGPAKGVLFSHRIFDAQVEEIQQFYGIEPGEVDVPGFPFFGLFDAAMGVTAVIPEMNTARPATVDPEKYIEAIDDWKATQSFASPAVWNRVVDYCERTGTTMPSLRRVCSAGAPIPYTILERLSNCIATEGEVHTPYGATESLPVASIGSRTVLGETKEKTRRGEGICVGGRFPRIEWRVIRIDDGPIASLSDAETLDEGQVGELIVTGPVVTKRYVTSEEANALAKITDDDGRIWHRIGDVGYLDASGRFWYCGRKAHRVQAQWGDMYTIPCESIINTHPGVFRSALVGIGSPGNQTPVMIIQQRTASGPDDAISGEKLLDEVRALASQWEVTSRIEHFLHHPAFPVDVRHNAKIFREQLAVWASQRVASG